MFLGKNHEQTILEISQGDYIAITAESFLVDRQAGKLSPNTLKFYRQFLHPFIQYCDDHSLKQIREITPDFLRRYYLAFAETHNPGGVHAAFRILRSFFRWILNEEIMPPEWKNPMLKVKTPKVSADPLEPIGDVRALIDTCKRGDVIGERDRAIFLFLLDTGVRAQELCNTNVGDIDLNIGSVMIKYGKGGKTRTVFIGRKTRRSLRTYLRIRHDSSPSLFVSKNGERLTYDGLRQILERRGITAKLGKRPTLHSFRRAFALNMLRSGVDIFALQRLMRYAELQVLRRIFAMRTVEDRRLKIFHGGDTRKYLIPQAGR